MISSNPTPTDPNLIYDDDIVLLTLKNGQLDRDRRNEHCVADIPSRNAVSKSLSLTSGPRGNLILSALLSARLGPIAKLIPLPNPRYFVLLDDRFVLFRNNLG